MGLIGFICEKHGYINVEKIGYKLCPDCRAEKSKRSEKYNHIQFSNFKPFFSGATGTVIESKKERDEIAKKNGWVFGDDKDLTPQAAVNKIDGKKKAKDKFSSGLKEELHKAFI